ncbi:MAG: DUF805 domain-containing protein [Acetobacter sp.]|nr:DUF805 domain-containing protein [Acetobacter sp.]
MVTKKTSKEDVKKVSTPATAEVKKPATKKTKSATAKTVEAKTTTTSKTPAKKTAAKKTAAVDYTPIAANQDVVQAVLETKAQNDAKKAAKKIKTISAKASAGDTGDKGITAAAAKSKRDAVKEKVQKAEARKFMELKKEETTAETCSSCSCCCVAGIKKAFSAWLDTYKNIMNYKGRTNRYDFWAFMLINAILVLAIAVPYEIANYNALMTRTVMTPAIVYAYWGFSIIEMFVYLALYVRRIHDTGVSGWKGFFRPLTFTALGLLALAIIGNIVMPENSMITNQDTVLSSLLGWAVVILLFINLYYLIKIFIATGFMEEERVENAYGAPKLMDECCKKKILRFASLYTLLVIVYAVILFSMSIYFSFSMLRNGGFY